MRVQAAYDTVAADYARHFPDTRPEAPVDLAMVEDFVRLVRETGPEPRSLDAGCGAGRMSRYLSAHALRVEGIDLSPRMVDEARRAHPDLRFEVAALQDLPYPEATFDGVLVWYAAIHTPPSGQPAIFAELARVVRPGGHVLVGFQAGSGVRDVAPSYRRLGHDIELVRYLYDPDVVVEHLVAAGFSETSRLVRRARGTERDDQAFVLARRQNGGGGSAVGVSGG